MINFTLEIKNMPRLLPRNVYRIRHISCLFQVSPQLSAEPFYFFCLMVVLQAPAFYFFYLKLRNNKCHIISKSYTSSPSFSLLDLGSNSNLLFVISIIIGTMFFSDCLIPNK